VLFQQKEKTHLTFAQNYPQAKWIIKTTNFQQVTKQNNIKNKILSYNFNRLKMKNRKINY